MQTSSTRIKSPQRKKSIDKFKDLTQTGVQKFLNVFSSSNNKSLNIEGINLKVEEFQNRITQALGEAHISQQPGLTPALRDMHKALDDIKLIISDNNPDPKTVREKLIQPQNTINAKLFAMGNRYQPDQESPNLYDSLCSIMSELQKVIKEPPKQIEKNLLSSTNTNVEYSKNISEDKNDRAIKTPRRLSSPSSQFTFFVPTPIKINKSTESKSTFYVTSPEEEKAYENLQKANLNPKITNSKEGNTHNRNYSTESGDLDPKFHQLPLE